MNKKLPQRPNLDHLRRQAKTLLADLHRGYAEAARTFTEHLPEAKKLTPAKVRAAGYRLADAQSAIARKTGFASWPSLSRHVEALRGLEGDWRFESLEIDGTSVPASSLGESKMLIDGDCFRMESPEGNYEGVFTIDVDAIPPRIDIEFVEGPEAGNWSYGLFELRGDALTFCLGLVGSPRPTAFATSPGSGHALERLKRATAKRPSNVKGGKRPSVSLAAETPSPEVDASTFEVAMTPLMARLQGEWEAVELVRDGQRTKEDWLPYGSRKTEGNETRVVFGGQTMLHAKMRIDEAAKPMAVDYLNLAGSGRGRVSFGVLKSDGEEVTFHVAPVGKPRPSDFVSLEGNGTTLSRWRRKS